MRQDHHVTTITQFHANNKRNDVNYSDGDWEPLAAPLRMKSFFFYEDHKVEKFLLYKIERLQQMANKRIAKAWIKGICPRKQAKFPYSNKARGEKQNLPPLIPGWWPAHGCPFIEPDHITKSGTLYSGKVASRVFADFRQSEVSSCSIFFVFDRPQSNSKHGTMTPTRDPAKTTIQSRTLRTCCTDGQHS